MEEIKAAAAGNELATEYEAYLQTATDAKAKYLSVYKEIIGRGFCNLCVLINHIAQTPACKLCAQSSNTKHLEEYNKTLAQDNEEVENWDAICQTIREKWFKILTESFEAFWCECDVDNSMASLELLKHKFKEFEGVSWNLQQKAATERILPIKIQLKQMKVRYLEQQLQVQQERMEQLMEENKKKRERIQNVSHRRLVCINQMKNLSLRFKELNSALPEMLDFITTPSE